MSEGYKGPDVCKFAKISYRQLDYWARTGLLTPSVQDAAGSGSQRLYSFEDIVQLRAIKRLLEAGISLQRIRGALDFLRRNVTGDLHDITLVSDGTTVMAVDDERELIDLLKGGQGMFTIDLGGVYDDVAAEVARLPVQLPLDAGVEEAAVAPDVADGQG